MPESMLGGGGQVSREFSIEDYKMAVGSFVTGITVVTASGEEGPVGFTCQSFTSLSLDPPTILISVAQTSRTLSTISSEKKFCVNILSTGSVRIAHDFAFMDPAVRFTMHSWNRSGTGNPVLEAALVWLDCELVRSIEVEDHLVAVGRVVSLGASEEGRDPLTYYRGDFGAFAQLNDE